MAVLKDNNLSNSIMAYNKFKKLETLRIQFGINEITAAWLPKSIPAIKSTKKLLEDLQEAALEFLTTEKAKSEYVVVPILRELRRINNYQFSTFSGFEFNVDSKIGLNGFCDFILSAETKKSEVSAPIICLVEAKNAEIERGLAQCGAEMYAAHLFNDQRGQPRKAIYGCVTNAFSWCFLKLENKNLLIDPNYIPLTFANPNEVLAVWQWVLDKSLANE